MLVFFRLILFFSITSSTVLQLAGQSPNTVALNEDFLVIGDPNYQERIDTYSSLFIYKKVNNSWKLIKKIRPPEGLESDFFGENISIVNNKIYVSDQLNSLVYLMEIKNDKVIINNIYQNNDPTETRFGCHINANDDLLLVGSSQAPDPFSKRKGLIHVFDVSNGSLEFIQTLYALGSEHTNFGANIITGKYHEYLISSNASAKNNKSGSVYLYKKRNGQLELEAQIKSPNPNKHDGFGDVMHSNSDFLFVREVTNNHFLIRVYDLSTISSNPVILQTITPPSHLEPATFGEQMASSVDKLYLSFTQKDGSSGILIYNLDCSNQWRFIQQILPQTKKQYQELSLAANGNTLAIGTQKSSFREYYDLKALDDGVVKLYEYERDSSQIAYLKVEKEDFYISPSGRKHTYSHVFWDTITNKNGCDSIINIDLKISIKDENGKIHQVTPNNNTAENRNERTVITADTIQLESEIIRISFFDHGQFDHDTISVKLNDHWILIDQEVTKEPQYIFAIPQKGYNRLLFRAENLGSEPPNTATIFIYDDHNEILQRKTLNTDLEKSATIILHR